MKFLERPSNNEFLLLVLSFFQVIRFTVSYQICTMCSLVVIFQNSFCDGGSRNGTCYTEEECETLGDSIMKGYRKKIPIDLQEEEMGEVALLASVFAAFVSKVHYIGKARKNNIIPPPFS